jgi:probable rRNA maturation factor
VTVLLAGPAPRDGLPVADRRLLRSRAVKLLRALGLARRELSIVLLDDRAIAALNARYRGQDRPTDVLSFSLLEGENPERSGNLLGDVIVGLETAARQARRAHRGLDQEIARLLIHGTLHLLGYDHQSDEEAREMRREERRLWRAIRE